MNGSMDERASIPPGLPRPNPTASYWQTPPADIADIQSTPDLPQSADIVIVGSGISGASIAYNVLTSRPDANVLLLEARQAASGASGRNGGHTKAASYRTFPGNVAKLGRDEAMKIAQFEYACMVAVHDFIREHGIACEGTRCHTADVIYDPIQWDEALKAVAIMQNSMGADDPAARYTVNSGEHTLKQLYCKNAVGSITYEAGSLSAYKFVIGILKLALDEGLKIHCNTPVIALERTITADEGHEKWLIRTSRGGLIAQSVVLATNGYTAHLYPKFQNVIIPLRGHVTAHRPGTGLPKEGLVSTYSFVYGTGYEYMVSQPNHLNNSRDLVIGGGSAQASDGGIGEYGNTDDTTINQDVVDFLTESTAKYFGQTWGEDHSDGRIRAAWSGIMGYSVDGLPFVGPVPGEKGLFISASFQGRGMVHCWLCAKALTQRLLEPDQQCGEWFPRSFWITEERLRARSSDELDSLTAMKPRRVPDTTSHARLYISA